MASESCSRRSCVLSGSHSAACLDVVCACVEGVETVASESQVMDLVRRFAARAPPPNPRSSCTPGFRISRRISNLAARDEISRQPRPSRANEDRSPAYRSERIQCRLHRLRSALRRPLVAGPAAGPRGPWSSCAPPRRRRRAPMWPSLGLPLLVRWWPGASGLACRE